MLDENWMTPEELEKALGFSTSSQAKLRCEGKLPYSKFGNRVFYSKVKISALLEDNSMEGMTQRMTQTKLKQISA